MLRFTVDGFYKRAYRGPTLVGYNDYLASGQELSNDLSSSERESIEKEWGKDDVCLYPVEVLVRRRGDGCNHDGVLYGRRCARCGRDYG